MKLLSIVFSFRNEEGNIEPLVQRISTTMEKVKDKSFPTDARIVKYVEDGVEHIDLTRGKKMVNIFDMYYDRYGKDAVKAIDFGYGSVNPKMWGYKSPEKKKRK